MKCRAYLYKWNTLCINFSDGFVSIDSAADTIVGEYIGCYLFEDMLSSEKAKDVAYERYQDERRTTLLALTKFFGMCSILCTNILNV